MNKPTHIYKILPLKPILILIWLVLSPGIAASAEIKLEFALSNSTVPLAYEKNHQSVGLLPELVDAVFKLTPNYDIDLKAYPWSRAQNRVESGTSDGFFTYPSASRQKYALFSDLAIYQLDYGYLVYHKDNNNRSTIQSATSFEDLRELTFMSQRGTAWENENIPSYIKREYAMSEEGIILNLLKRKAGDFLVMTPEEATYLAQKNGLEGVIRFQKVGFIPDSLIPFQIGISRKHPNADAIIQAINEVQRSDEFLQARERILKKYRF